LAVEYAYRYRADYDLVWWIPSDQRISIKRVLADLAPRLGLPPLTATGIEDAADAVLDALRRGEPYSRWLLIFDNANQPEDLVDVIPSGPGHVLITSHNTRWYGIVDVVDVDVWTRAESIEFLGKRIPGGINGADADRLAMVLGDFPLALGQASALLAETGMPTDEYLQLLHEQTSQLLAEGRPTEYPTSMTAAWTLSVSQLAERFPEAVDLLRCCAFFGPDPIPREVFIRGPQGMTSSLAHLLEQPVMMSRAIGELGRYALARINVRERSIQVHRLVQALVRAGLSTAEQRQAQSDARLLLVEYGSVDPADPEKWPVYSNVVDHLSLLGVEQSADRAVRRFALDVVRYLRLSGARARALSMAERLIATWRTAPDQDALDVTLAQQELGDILRALGEYRTAYDVDTATLAELEAAVGSDHEATVRSRVSVAADIRARGEFSAARALDEEMLDSLVRVYGSGDRRTCEVLHNLALDLALIGDYPRARTLHEQLYQASMPGNLGEMMLLSAWAGLARTIRLSGDYFVARDLGEDVYHYSVGTLGPDHPGSLRVAIDLATAHRRAGDLERSLELAEGTYTRVVKRFQYDHPEALAAATCLATVQRDLGDLRTSLGLITDITHRSATRYGTNHPYTHAYAGNLAVLRRLTGDPEHARRLNEDALTGLEEALGLDHHFSLTVAANLANDLATLGDVRGAVELGSEILPRLRTTLSEAHPVTLTCAANLSADLRHHGKTDEGEALRETTLQAFEGTLGLEHPVAHAALQGRRLDFDFEPLPM
jgi:tetratricopeptide (TPR) repeat protein